MAAQAAYRGKGTKLERETATPGVYAEVEAVRGLTPPKGSRDRVESTTLRSAAREYIAGEPDFGTVSFRLLKQDSAMFTTIQGDFTDESIRYWRITYPDTTVETFQGFVATFGVPDVSFDGVLEVEVEITVTGFSTWS